MRPGRSRRPMVDRRRRHGRRHRRGLSSATIGPGESIGELALLDGEPRCDGHRGHRHDPARGGRRPVRRGAARQPPAGSGDAARGGRSAAGEEPAAGSRACGVSGADGPAPTPSGSSSVASPAQLDPLAPGYFDDPAQQLARLREQGAVHWSDAIQSHVVLRYEDVHRMCRDRALLGSVVTLDPPDVPPSKRGSKMMIRRDGDDHLRLRRLVSKVFTPKAISRWAERSESIVDRLLDVAAERATSTSWLTTRSSCPPRSSPRCWACRPTTCTSSRPGRTR